MAETKVGAKIDERIPQTEDGGLPKSGVQLLSLQRGVKNGGMGKKTQIATSYSVGTLIPAVLALRWRFPHRELTM